MTSTRRVRWTEQYRVAMTCVEVQQLDVPDPSFAGDAGVISRGRYPFSALPRSVSSSAIWRYDLGLLADRIQSLGWGDAG